MKQDSARAVRRLAGQSRPFGGVEVTSRATSVTVDIGEPTPTPGGADTLSLTSPVSVERISTPKSFRSRDHATPWLFSPASRFARIGIDAAILAGALICAELTAPGGVGPSAPVWVVLFTGLVIVFLQMRDAYRQRLRIQVLEDLRLILSTTALAAMVVLALRVLLQDDPQTAGQTFRQWAFAVLFLLVGRAAIDLAELRARKHGAAGRRTLIVGAGTIGRLVARRLVQYPELGLKPVGFLDDAPLENGEPSKIPVLGGSGQLVDIVRQHEVEHLIVTFSTASHRVLLDIVDRCEQLGVGVSFVPRLFEKMKEKVSIESVGSIPLILVQPTDPKSWQFTVKYALDRIAAAGLLLILSPVLLATAVAVWLSSGRPVLYTQPRVGRDGRAFEMLKFRSMTPQEGESLAPSDLPPDTAPGGTEDAERKTRVGSMLRRTALDELPQLVNVLRGEMSLVGPRPERPEFVEAFETSIHRYGERHRVKAGMTGWAQISGLRGNTSLSDRAEWDNYYIDNWSLWLDLKILLSTAASLVRSPSD